MKSQVSLKTYLGTILILLIITFASVSFVRSAGETAISDKSFVSEASWIVGKDGSDTYMKNGETGEIPWEDSNSGAVINACVGNLTSGRTWKETVVVRGTFSITGTIIIDSDYTVLDLTDAYLSLGADTDMITIGSPTALQQQVEIRGGVLDGNNAIRSSGNLINLYGSYCKILGVTIVYAKENGVRIRGDSSHSTYAWQNSIVDCYFSDNELAGIYIENWVAYLPIEHCYFDGNNVATSSGIAMIEPSNRSGGLYIDDCNFYQLGAYGCLLRGSDNWVSKSYFWYIGLTAIRVESDSNWGTYGNQIVDNNIADASYGNDGTYSAIYVVGKTGQNAFKNRIEGNIIQKFGSDQVAYGINETLGEYNVYNDNYIDNGVCATDEMNIGSDSVLYRNYGFVTENSVTFSGIGNGTYVAHDCAGTPDYVTITLSTQGYGWYGTKNSTHCQLYFSTSTASGTAKFEYEP